MSLVHIRNINVFERCAQKKINLSKTARKMPITADMATLGSSIRDESLPMPKYDDVRALSFL